MNMAATNEAAPALAPVPPQTNGLAAALVRAQQRARAIGKDAYNPHHGYSYASAEAVMVEARNALTEEGLCVMQGGWKLTRDEEGSLVSVRFEIIHEGGEVWTRTLPWPVIETKGRPRDKALSAALTSAEGYFLRGLLCLPRVSHADDIEQRDDTGFAPEASPEAEAPPNSWRNQYEGTCVACGKVVQKKTGWSTRSGKGADGKQQYRTIHHACWQARRDGEAVPEPEEVAPAACPGCGEAAWNAEKAFCEACGLSGDETLPPSAAADTEAPATQDGLPEMPGGIEATDPPPKPKRKRAPSRAWKQAGK
jgi:hypothetical protein